MFFVIINYEIITCAYISYCDYFFFPPVYIWSWKLNLHFNSLDFTARGAGGMAGRGGVGLGVEGVYRVVVFLPVDVKVF